MDMCTILQYAKGQYLVNKKDVPRMLKRYSPYKN